MRNQPDLAEQVIVPNLPWIIGGGMLLGLIAILAWVFITWLRIKHGYPLETAWGKAIEPRVTTETAERMKLLSGENAPGAGARFTIVIPGPTRPAAVTA